MSGHEVFVLFNIICNITCFEHVPHLSLPLLSLGHVYNDLRWIK